MVIAKYIFTGKCRRLNWNGKSDGIRGIRGINTSSLVPHPVSIVHSRKFTVILLANVCYCKV